MDDLGFQHQLHALKERISELSLKYPPTTRASSSFDPFASQMSELKAHMAALHEHLSRCEQSMPQTAFYPPGQNSVGDGRKSFQVGGQFVEHVGRAFSQTFETLQTDVRSLDSRLASLEGSISDLEDRVDTLDPNRFTPPGSATSSCPVSIPGLITPLYNRNMPTTVPNELPRDVDYWESDKFPYTTIAEQNVTHSSTTAPDLKVGSLRTGVDNVRDVTEAILRRLTAVEGSNVELRQVVQDLKASYKIRTVVASDVGLPALSRHCSPVHSITFRDREIARLDEQIGIAQERLRISEDTASQHQSMIEQLQLERDDYCAANSDWMQKDYELRSELQLKDIEITHLQDQIAESNSTSHELEERCARLNDSYRYATTRWSACESRLRNEREGHETIRNEALRNHEKDIKSLRAFCEQKDGVVHEQEQIISRGRKLLEQRDDEIESLQRELRAMTDERDHAIRAASRTSRLLGERDAELAHMKDISKVGGQRQRRSGAYTDGNHSSECDWREALPPVPQASSERTDHSNDADLETATQNQHIPKIPRVGRRSSRRAVQSHRSDDIIPEDKALGMPDLVSHERRERQRRGERDAQISASQHQPGETDQLPFNVNSPETLHPSNSPITGKQFKQGPDDATWMRPPLPALFTAVRRMGSEMNLRTNPPDNANPARNSLSKYHSMHELRGRYQAYVESDAESGERGEHETGEFGGAV